MSDCGTDVLVSMHHQSIYLFLLEVTRHATVWECVVEAHQLLASTKHTQLRKNQKSFLIIIPMHTNHSKIVTRSVFIGVSAFIVLSLWDWIELGSVRLLINAIASIAIALASMIADKIFLKQ